MQKATKYLTLHLENSSKKVDNKTTKEKTGAVFQLGYRYKGGYFMVVDMDKCVGCGQCFLYCPSGAISLVEKKAVIDMDKCVECGTCKRIGICKKDAFVQQTLGWPRYIRAILSNVSIPAPNTGVGGRGTEEMKTNEVTHRFKPGMVGIGCEMGRPNIGTSMKDVETIAKVVIAHGGVLEECNPIMFIMEDAATGKVKESYYGERATSVIIEAIIPIDNLKGLLLDLKEAQHNIDTVFSVDVITVMDGDKIPTWEICKSVGLEPRPNGKTNVG